MLTEGGDHESKGLRVRSVPSPPGLGMAGLASGWGLAVKGSFGRLGQQLCHPGLGSGWDVQTNHTTWAGESSHSLPNSSPCVGH